MSMTDPGGIVRNVTESLKGSPSCLAAILLAAMFAILTYFALVEERKEGHERMMKLIEVCAPSLKLK